ncbi:MAG: hypothetical protein ACXABK_04790 [Candidatus Heimdallarchaeaceae archaeon]|jgi:hypothetical protein
MGEKQSRYSRRRRNAFQDYIDDTEEDKQAKEEEYRNKFSVHNFKESKFYGLLFFLYVVFYPLVLIFKAIALLSYSLRRRYYW